jgi:hypothetical protein
MTESEVEQVVLNSVRKYTLNQSVTMESQFDADLKLTTPARQMLFAFVAEAFNARGVSLPSHGFYLSDFLACATPGAVRDVIVGKMFGGRAKAKAAHGASHHAATPAAAPHAPAHPPSHATAHAPAPQHAATSEPAAVPATATSEATASAEPVAAPGAESEKKPGAKKKAAAKKPAAKRIRRRPN